jgi:ABC-type uncharacterized transport system YnjBCD ATPase subunit
MIAKILGRENGNQLSRGEIQDKYELFDGMARAPMSKGDVVIVTGSSPSDIKSLFTCCPGCGDSSFTSTHKITEDAQGLSVLPSLQFQCCKWHGHLTNGVFIPC